MSKALSQVGVVVLIVLAWMAVSALHLWPPYLFPSPVDVGATLVRLTANGELLYASVRTLGRIALGFGIAAIGGMLMGIALARYRRLSELFGPIAQGLQGMPSICWFPLAILWFGLTEQAIYFVTVVGALFAIATATEAALRSIPQTYVRAATTMGARGTKLYLRVILPAALPQLLIGLRAGWSFGWRSLMAAELLFMNLGLGQLLNMGRDLADAAQVVAIILVILVIGLLVDRLLFARTERAVRRRWGFEAAA
ncbi:MAG: transporter permease protein [Firmicutes bacterium]|nr:transporter permease protein [Bacillota bacterium]